MLRLTDKELTSLLDGIESDRAERKAAYRGDVSKKAVRRCALLLTTASKSEAPAALMAMSPRKISANRALSIIATPISPMC